MIFGCDVSYAQGVIGWVELVKMIAFCIVRGGYGTTIYDTRAKFNRDMARSLGCPLMHYWYLPMPSASPLTLAAAIITGLGVVYPGEPIALDIEEDDPNLVEIVYNVALALIGHYGQPPVLYMNLDFLRRYNWGLLTTLNCGLWLAHWDKNPASVDPTYPFPFAAFKQDDNAGQLTGISGPALLDVFYGDVAAFHAYGAVNSAVAPAAILPRSEPQSPLGNSEQASSVLW